MICIHRQYAIQNQSIYNKGGFYDERRYIY